jgi:drug/metabolite transporter (DMT)-like permease
VLLFGVATAAGGVALARADRRAVLLMVAGGALDMGANILYVLATQHGTLPVVVTLTSLYPASTVVLARVVLGERLGAAQRAGIACALAAVVLIVAGEPR